MSVQIKVSDLFEALPPDLEVLPDGRLRLIRYHHAGQNWAITEDMFPPYLTPDALATDLLLTQKKLVDHRAVDPFGKLKHRKILIVTFDALPAAGAVPVQYGNPEVRAAEGAFKLPGGSTSPGFSLPGQSSVMKPAREFTYKYMVGGDSTVNNDWLAENVRYYADLGNNGGVPPDGESERYFVGQRTISEGVIFGTIEATFCELPDTYTYPENINFRIPGLGQGQGSMPQVSFSDPITIEDISCSVSEAYHLGAPSPASPTFQVTQWATVTETFTPDASGQEQQIVTGYSGYLAGASGTVVATGTWLWRGVLVTGLTVEVVSVPTTVPSGLTSVQLKQERWKGNIWRTRTKSFAFP